MSLTDAPPSPRIVQFRCIGLSGFSIEWLVLFVSAALQHLQHELSVILVTALALHQIREMFSVFCQIYGYRGLTDFKRYERKGLVLVAVSDVTRMDAMRCDETRRDSSFVPHIIDHVYSSLRCVSTQFAAYIIIMINCIPSNQLRRVSSHRKRKKL